MEMKRGGIAATQLKSIISWLKEREGEKTFDSNVRRSIFRLKEAGLLQFTVSNGTPFDISLTEQGYLQGLNISQKVTLAHDAFKSSTLCISLPVRLGTVLATDKEVKIDTHTYSVSRADFVIRNDGKTCLQLSNKQGEVKLIDGPPLVIARWYKQVLEAGVAGGVQINEGKPG